MSNECPKCSEYAEEGKTFCGACGRSLTDDNSNEEHPAPADVTRDKAPEKSQGGLAYIILLCATIFVIAIAIIEALALILNTGEIFNFLSDKATPLFLLLPFALILGYLSEAALQAYWLLIVTVLLSCVAAGVIKFITTLKESKGAESGEAENTAVFWICIFLSAMLLISYVVTVLTAALGSDVTTPDFGGKIEQMFLLAEAAFWEEIAVRLVLIGLPMMLISFVVTKKKESLKCLFGGFGMSTSAVVLIIVSGAIFGLAHYSGWDDQAWKVLTASIMGVFLGYLFVRFGLYASMLAHFITNYLSAFNWLGIGVVEFFISILLIVMGVLALYYILKRLADSVPSINALPLFKNGYIKKDDNAP